MATVLNNTRETIDDAAGLKFKIDRAETALKGADSEIYESQRNLAELGVSIKKQEKALIANRQAEKQQKTALKTLHAKYEASGFGARPSEESAALARRLDASQAKLLLIKKRVEMNEVVLAQYKDSYSKCQEHVQLQMRSKEEVALGIATAQISLDGLKMREMAAGVRSSTSSSLANATALLAKVSEEVDIRLETLNINDDPYRDANSLAVINEAQVLQSVESLLSE